MAEPTASPTSLEGVILITPEPIPDDRGFFVRTMSADVLASAGIDARAFVQENQSRSRRGTLRGLHGRSALGENKLVRCARGALFEVVVDLRPWSATFGRWESFELDDRTHRQLYVPAGCVHGFQALSAEIDVCYKHDDYYRPQLEISVAWDDPELAIPWPLADPLLSERDRAAPRVDEIRPLLRAWYGDHPPSP
jgi:dTDP-4-dehydrorhamnose 3,5-epimerase